MAQLMEALRESAQKSQVTDEEYWAEKELEAEIRFLSEQRDKKTPGEAGVEFFNELGSSVGL